MAQHGSSQRHFWLILALLGSFGRSGPFRTATARMAFAEEEELEAHATDRLKILSEELARRHSESEAIYWEARARSDQRKQQLPDYADKGFQRSATNLGGDTRIWDYYTPDYNCPLLKERVGRIGDGGKWVCGVKSNLLQTAGCLVYSLGSAGDTSFEDAMMQSTVCEVHTFDPTLPSEVQAAVQSNQKLHFHNIGVGNPNTHLPARFKMEQVETSKLEELEAIMARLQHTWIDVLKIDIEGFEWELFKDFYRSGARLPATQVLVEFHFKGESAEVWEVLDLLLADKYRIFSVEPNYYCEEGCCAKDLLEFAFIKVSDHGQICAPKGGRGGDRGAAVLPEAC